MSSSSASESDRPFNQSWGHCGGGRRGRPGRKNGWSPVNTAAMVIGFIFFWPVGLLILFWICSGRHVQDLPAAIQHKWSMFFGKSHCSERSARHENTVFSDYQQTQYDRISEIKEEIKERERRFKEYRTDTKKREDEKEFNDFMSDSPVSNQ